MASQYVDLFSVLGGGGGGGLANAFSTIHPITGVNVVAVGATTLNLTSAGDGNLNINGTNTSKTIDLSLKSPITSGGVTSVDWAGRQIVDSLGTPSVDYANRVTLDLNEIVSIDYQNRVLYDSNGASIFSMDWNARQAYSALGATTLNWDASFLFNGSGDISVQWDTAAGGGVLYADGQSSSLDWNNRVAYDGGGAFSFDYGSRLLVDIVNGNSLNWNSRIAIDTASVSALSWGNRFLFDIGGGNSVYWGDPAGLTIYKKFSTYNGQSVVGNGVAAILGNVDLSNQAASIADTTIFTPAAAGMYRASVYAEVTTAGTAGTVSFQIKYSDDNGAQAVDPLPVANLSLAATGFSQGMIVIRSGSATAIKYNATVTGLLGTPKFALKIILERLS